MPNFNFIALFILFGFYPDELIWRPILVITLILAHAMLFTQQVRSKTPLRSILISALALETLSVWLIFGDDLVLTGIEQNQLSGLMLNLCLAYWSIPIATLLATIATYLIIYNVNPALSTCLQLISKFMRSIPLRLSWQVPKLL